MECQNIKVENVGEELFFGMVAPVGTDFDFVKKELELALKTYGYRLIHIKLSSFLHLSDPNLSTFDTEYNRISDHMTAGNNLRSSGLGNHGILAKLAVTKVFYERQKQKCGDGGTHRDKNAYLFDSLKHPAEIHFLKNIYGPNYSTFSIYTPRKLRVNYLTSKPYFSSGDPKHDAEELIKRDYLEESKFGQAVSKAFPIGDLFINTSKQNAVGIAISRYLKIFFNYPFHAPTKDEYGMFMATGSAFRSGDLSRQVGAAIMSKHSSIIALGTNEVPKNGGGLYWEDNLNDRRDYFIGHDTNTKTKNIILNKTFEKILEHLSSSVQGSSDAHLVTNLLNNIKSEQINAIMQKLKKETPIGEIIEYFRTVHAEMASICDAALNGIHLAGSTMYVTTFPCHLCTKHIIANGIKRVVYLEPYPKSRAEEMYDDSIIVDPDSEAPNRMSYVQYEGISPHRYAQFFKSIERKNDETGEKVAWPPDSFKQRFGEKFQTYRVLEICYIKELSEFISKFQQKEIDAFNISDTINQAENLYGGVKHLIDPLRIVQTNEEESTRALK